MNEDNPDILAPKNGKALIY